MNDGLRVLHLIWSAGGGGAERQLAYLATGQCELGLDVHIGIFRGGINLSRLEASGAAVHWMSSRGTRDPLIVPRIARLIRKVRPAIVQTWLVQMDVVGGTAALLTRTPWIASERSSGAHYPKELRYRMRKILGRYADAVIANSPGGSVFWNGPHVRKFVVPNAVAMDEIAAAVPAADHFGGSRVVLFAGRLEQVKNLPNLIGALVPLVRSADVVALLCGAGPLEQEVRRLIDAAGCGDRIRLTGFREDVWGLMKRADVLVAPSWYEGHPNSVIEAAAACCPLVVSDIPAHRAFLDDSTALFAPPEDREALSRAIAMALHDQQASAARAAAAQHRVAEWSIGNISAQYERIYREVVA
ncbi:MAG TPA: glycosyltransferase [Thermoanaerobaculia bacterium]|nr:glycosyltransferase [Thermoanaerobaculia bacterium]